MPPPKESEASFGESDPPQIEETHLKDAVRLKTLFSVLTIAF